jgi:predicted nucleotidyltransferase
MNAQDALATLRRYESVLRARGITHAALFGSVARGENRPDSDLDIMIDIDPEAHVTLFDYAGLKDYIASLFDGPVDVIDREALKPELRAPTARDMVYAF